jgi:excisionase family DNA binding protein
MTAGIDIAGLNRTELVELLALVLARLLLPETPTPSTPGCANAPPATALEIASDQLLSAKQVAARWSVPESWVRDQARNGKLASLRLGRYVRFRPSDLDRFFENPKPALLRLTASNGIHRV